MGSGVRAVALQSDDLVETLAHDGLTYILASDRDCSLGIFRRKGSGR